MFVAVGIRVMCVRDFGKHGQELADSEKVCPSPHSLSAYPLSEEKNKEFNDISSSHHNTVWY